MGKSEIDTLSFNITSKSEDAPIYSNITTVEEKPIVTYNTKCNEDFRVMIEDALGKIFTVVNRSSKILLLRVLSNLYDSTKNDVYKIMIEAIDYIMPNRWKQATPVARAGFVTRYMCDFTSDEKKIKLAVQGLIDYIRDNYAKYKVSAFESDMLCRKVKLLFLKNECMKLIFNHLK